MLPGATSRSGTDHTEAMRRWAEARVRELEGEDLCGYVLKKDSPSCGMERVKVYAKGPAARSGRGLFAEALMGRMPLLPVEEEGRLNDPRLRENFIERVFAYRRLKDLFGSRWTDDLVRFHARSSWCWPTTQRPTARWGGSSRPPRGSPARR
ncbi:MAG TPA: DUF523 domain-containing protein [Anaeromyxobacteraceae bacterium]|nr:DUF523 domain-containing protein [Anaeromyxobacteraceae bacterium]